MTQLTALNSRPGVGSRGGFGKANDQDQSPLISTFWNLFFLFLVLLQTSHFPDRGEALSPKMSPGDVSPDGSGTKEPEVALKCLGGSSGRQRN